MEVTLEFLAVLRRSRRFTGASVPRWGHASEVKEASFKGSLMRARECRTVPPAAVSQIFVRFPSRGLVFGGGQLTFSQTLRPPRALARRSVLTFNDR